MIIKNQEFPDLIFQCIKCDHNLFISKKKLNFVISLYKYNCPNCGEDGYENWIILGEGNFKKEKKNFRNII